jgi:hypothetical protein
MDYKKINSWLNNLTTANKKLKFVEKQIDHQGIPDNAYDGSQGNYNEYSNIFQVVSEPEIFIKVTYQTDSYGSNDSLTSVQFVQGVKKTIEVFEPIK